MDKHPHFTGKENETQSGDSLGAEKSHSELLVKWLPPSWVTPGHALSTNTTLPLPKPP